MSKKINEKITENNKIKNNKPSIPEMVVNIIKNYSGLDKNREGDTTFVIKGSKNRNKPIILLFTGDWHIGSKSCDHDRLFSDLDYIINNIDPADLRIFLLGDLIDNVGVRFKNTESVFGYIPPSIQKDVLIEVLNKISQYIDISCWGNHDIEWDEKYMGISDLSRKLKKVSTFFYGRGLVKYNVGKQSYSVFLSHKFMGKSWFHPLQGNIRGWLESHADIVVSGHYHNFGYLNDFYGLDENGNPMERHLIQVGTYNYVDDRYSERYFAHPVCRNGCLILFNNIFKIMYFSDFKDGIKYYKDLINTSKSTTINKGEKK